MTSMHRLLVLCFAGAIVGCARHSTPVTAALPITPVSIADVSASFGTQVALEPDPHAAVLTGAEQAFLTGQRELADGHIVAARASFDDAVDQLLAIPEGARATPGISAAFDRLLDRITALEVIALREGDGLTEVGTESAAIDELLSVAIFERPKPALTTAETVRADLERTPHDIDIPANDRVLSFVELFQGRLHSFIAGGLERGHRYLPMIRRIFREEGVPLDLVYIPIVESAFKPTAYSRASARGIWQFMPATGAEHGLRQDFWVDERSEPEKATRAAAQYLKTLRDMFNGDWALALASYNAGPGRVQRAARRARTTDYWTLTASAQYLPRETREYVPMIMAAIIIAKNPELYGFDLGVGEPLAYERITVPRALDLKYIAEWTGVTVEHLRELNPELRRTTTPMEGHPLKVPVGTGPTILRQLASAEPLYVQFGFHTVRRGETLSTIARQYQVSLADLRNANADQLGTRSLIRVNQALMIPSRPTPAIPTAVTRTASTPRPSPPVTSYSVVRGDTLYGIARRFDTTVAALKQANRLQSNLINVGDRLTIR
jgi:membrane-bound lytic murein transglycosylase D